MKILEGAGSVERFRPRENMAIVRINAEGDEPSLINRVNPNAHVQLTVLRGVEGLRQPPVWRVHLLPPRRLRRQARARPAQPGTRALKLLAGELPIDYVPPFRGNAVRVNDRSRRARDLVINFKELESRKQREYDKLERMIKYARSTGCRRSYILGYFGDHDASECGRCDNCGPIEGRASQATARPIDNQAGREVVLKVLSGVARARGKFGKVAVAQMLIGSKSEKMTKLGLNRLSTFGILSEFAQPEVAQLIDALASSGLVESTDVDRFRPVVDITEAGREFLKSKGDTPLQLALSDELSTKVRFGGLQKLKPPAAKAVARVEREADEGSPKAEAADPDPDLADVSGDPLYLKLKAMRASWAREANQSAYTIFPNKTLEALVRQRPRSPHELAAIKGVGPVIRERYGSALMAAIAGHPSKANTPAPIERRPDPGPGLPATKAAPASPGSNAYVPTEEWTWRLLDRGFGLEDAAAIRGLELAAIVRHATFMARKGHPVALDRCLAPERLAAWDELRGRGETGAPPDDDPAGLWALFLACRSAHP